MAADFDMRMNEVTLAALDRTTSEVKRFIRIGAKRE